MRLRAMALTGIGALALTSGVATHAFAAKGGDGGNAVAVTVNHPGSDTGSVNQGGTNSRTASANAASCSLHDKILHQCPAATTNSKNKSGRGGNNNGRANNGRAAGGVNGVNATDGGGGNAGGATSIAHGGNGGNGGNAGRQINR